MKALVDKYPAEDVARVCTAEGGETMMGPLPCAVFQLGGSSLNPTVSCVPNNSWGVPDTVLYRYRTSAKAGDISRNISQF